MSTRDVKRYINNRNAELNSVAVYMALAAKEPDSRMADIYRRLAATEQKHAALWEEKIKEQGEAVPRFKISWRTKVIIWLANKYGLEFVLPTLASLESANSEEYSGQPEAAGLVNTERSHALLLKQMTADARGIEGSALAKIEGLHRTAGGNALRAAVLGASDGLLSNFNLIMGVAGAQLSRPDILLTGVAGLLAGAISMGLGEWISVQSSRELYEQQIRTEKEEIEESPAEEIEEMVLIYQARGMDEESARILATKLMSNPESALATLARDELGINPEELGGSAWEAAFTSFLLFAVGAVLPIIPYFFWNGAMAAIASAVFSTGGLFFIGAAITLFTGRSVIFSGLRQVMFGLLAAGAVYFIGWIVGVKMIG